MEQEVARKRYKALRLSKFRILTPPIGSVTQILFKVKHHSAGLLENGSAVTMFEFRENGIIGANLLFGNENTYPLNIYAVTECKLLHMPKSVVLELLRDYNFVLHYIDSLSLNSRGMNRKITMLTQKTLRENLMDYLRHQAAVQGSSDIRLPISKKELADYMGVQRPSLFRELKRMKEEGLIDVSNRLIRILN